MSFPIRARVDELLRVHRVQLPIQLQLLYQNSSDDLILHAALSRATDLKDREWEALERVEELKSWPKCEHGVEIEFTDELISDCMELLIDLNRL